MQSLLCITRWPSSVCSRETINGWFSKLSQGVHKLGVSVSAASAHVKGALGRGYVPAAHALWLLVIYFFASLHFCALFYPRSPRIFFIYLDPLVAFYQFFYFLSLDYFWIWAIYSSRSPLFFLFFFFAFSVSFSVHVAVLIWLLSEWVGTYECDCVCVCVSSWLWLTACLTHER